MDKVPQILFSLTLMLLLVASQCRTTASAFLNEFIEVPRMRMDEYNFWYNKRELSECARLCIEEARVDCRSFSYRTKPPGCGIYEKDRDIADKGVYIGGLLQDSNKVEGWIYYEKKSPKYKTLEQKINFLKNLTEILPEEAGALFSSLNNDLSSIATNSSNAESSGNSTSVGITAAELSIITDIILKVAEMNPVKNANVETSKLFASDILRISNNLINPTLTSKWISLQKDNNAAGITGIVTSSEVVGRDVGQRLLAYDNSTGSVSKESEMGMWMDIVDGNEKFEFTKTRNLYLGIDDEYDDKNIYLFPQKSTNEEVESGTPEENDLSDNDLILLPSTALTNRSVVCHVRYKYLQQVIPTRNSDIRTVRGIDYEMKSSVLTTSIYPKPQDGVFDNNPVVIVFRHKLLKNESAHESEAKKITSECVYWETNGELLASGWSRKGCELLLSNKTHTVCKCTHLTSFAVLMKIVDTRTHLSYQHYVALSWISKVGCILSLVGVVIMCSAFALLKFRTENMKIHFHLGLAVGLANLVFLFMELASQAVASCIVVTILLYYFNMTVLSWMLIEGLFLYTQVVIVFVSARRWVRYFMLAGWGIPGVFTVVAMGILNIQIGKTDTCWLSPSDNSIWAFAAPAILVIVINTFILASVVKIIFNLQPDKTDHVKIDKIKNAAKGSIFLAPLLGTTWLFGLLSLTGNEVIFQYLFAITNSLQGFFLFLFHCLCSHEVREDVSRHQYLSNSIRKHNKQHSNWYSNSFGSGVVSGLRKLKNSVVSFDPPSTAPSSMENSFESPKNAGKQYQPTLATLNERLDEVKGVRPCATIHSKKHSSREKRRKRKRRKRSQKSNITSINETVCVKNKRDDSTMGIAPLAETIVRNDVIIKSKNKVQPIMEDVTTPTVNPANDNAKITEESVKKEIEKKMQMSYDSGLNSIDNESILEEEEECNT